MAPCFLNSKHIVKKLKLKYQIYNNRACICSGKFHQEKIQSHFDSKDAITATLTSPNFKLKSVDSQEKKDTYKK